MDADAPAREAAVISSAVVPAGLIPLITPGVRPIHPIRSLAF